MFPRPKVIFFDAAETLFGTSRPVGEIYAEAARSHGLRIDAQELSARFREAFHRRPPLAFPGVPREAIPERERAWWRDLVAEVFAPFAQAPDVEAFFETLYRTFDSARGWHLFPETTEVLERLTTLGYPLGIISNFDSRLRAVCRGLGIAGYFSTMTISSEVGAAKPDPAIFRHALAAHGVTPGEALHVGDNPEGDIEGALTAGLRAVLVDRLGRHAAFPAPRIRSLAELLPPLGG